MHSWQCGHLHAMHSRQHLVPPCSSHRSPCRSAPPAPPALQVWGNWEHMACRGDRIAEDKYRVSKTVNRSCGS